MQTILTPTQDGSPTLYVPELNEHFHSMYGAIRESRHVYIDNALNRIKKDKIRLFEIGFGTGLNAMLACCEAEKQNKSIICHSIEKFILRMSVRRQLLESLTAAYPELSGYYGLVNESEWDREVQLTNFFSLWKINADLLTFYPSGVYDVIFFDAFAPRVQPEMWTPGIFSVISGIMDHGAVLATYSATGNVRRNMISAGLVTERIAGPPGKREMLIAIKP
jgi:tRNA U34 5-methylaminomethyl-2-thiouridine-forming methyltransferase MnmC